MARILVVDDQSRIVNLLIAALQKSGYEVDGAISAELALDKLAEQSYDVVMSDIQMPGMSGVDLLKMIKETAPNTKVILFTGQPAAESVSEAFREGAVDYLTKPIDFDILSKTVESALRVKALDDLNRNYKNHLEEEIEKRTKALQDSEERFRYLYTHTPAMMHSIDADGKIVAVSDYWLEKMGYSREEVIGHKSTEFLTDESRRMANEVYLPEFFKTGKAKDSYYEFVTKSGEVLDILLSAISEKDEQGNLIRSMGILEDVTERKKAEEGLRQYEAIVSSSQDMIALIDQDLHYLSVNDAYAEVVAKPKEDIIGRTVPDIFPEDIFQRILKPRIEKCLSGKEVRYQEWFQLQDIKPIYMDILYSPYFGLDGNVSGFVVNARDISKQKQAEDALRESEERHRTYVANAPDGIFIADQDGHYIDVNDAACKMTGYTRDELLSMRISDLALIEINELSTTNFENLKEKGATERELVLRRKDGSDFWVSLRAVKIDESHYIGFNSDITKRKETEVQLSKYRNFLEKAQEIGKIGTWELDIPNNKLFWTDQNYKIFGVPPGTELTYETFLSCIHPDDREFVDREWKASFQTKKYEIEHRLFVDGKVKWVRQKAELEFNEKDECIRGIGFTQDITYRKQSEEALLEGEKRYHELFNAMGTCVAVYEPVNDGEDFIFADINPAGEAHSKAKREEIIGKPVTEVFPGVKDLGLFEVFQRVHRTGNTETLPLALYHDGRMQEWVENTVYKLPNGHIVAVYDDTSEQHYAEEQLRHSEALHRTLVEAIPDLVWLKDPDGVYLSCNYAFENYFGAKEEEIVGKTDYEFVEKELADFFRENDLKAITANRPRRNEEWLIFKKTGYQGLFETIKSPMHDPDGKLIGVLGIARDITDRKKAEAALRKSEANLKQAQAVASLGHYMFYILENRWTCSEALENVFGIDEKFAKTAEGWLLVVHPEDQQMMGDYLMNEVIGKGKKFNREYRIIRVDDGRERWVHGLGDLNYNAQGQPIEMFGTIQDITERKIAELEKTRLEGQLRQAHKMESVGRLAGGVAHDFNNLLTGITGNVQLSQMDLSPEDPLYGTLEEIDAAAKRAGDLTRQLLAFSRKQIITPKIIDLNDLIINMEKMLGRIIGEDVELKTTLAKELCSIKADQGQIEQIIVNLAANARDAMPDGGRLTIETAKVQLEEADCTQHLDADPGDYVLLKVTDTGYGMDEEMLANIFEPFYTTKAEGQGTGLGLAMVYGIIRQHEGCIQVLSELNGGTSFNIYLPRVLEKPDSIKRQSIIDSLETGTETIFLVEDAATVRNIAVKILERIGYNVISAESGPKALEIVEKDHAPIDLLLTDVVMPKMNGRELAKKMQKLYPKLKVLYTSGYTEEVIAHHGILDEGLEFIPKPYTPKTLAKTVRKVLDK